MGTWMFWTVLAAWWRGWRAGEIDAHNCREETR